WGSRTASWISCVPWRFSTTRALCLRRRSPVRASRECAATRRRQRFLSHVPLRLAIDAGTAIGSPYRSDGESRIAVALQIRGQRAVVAAEVSLGEIEQRMRQLAGDDVARVVDARGRGLAGNTTTGH